MKTGKRIPTLALVEDEDWQSISLSTNAEFITIIERSRARQASERGIPIEEVRRRLGLRKPRRRG